jgi:chromate transporter
VSLRETFAVFLRIGLLSFGGPAGQIALLHRELVEQRQWLREREFLSALNFCMLLPGPEAMQLATYAGWKRHGVTGGLMAGLLFVLPGACLILALSVLYARLGNLPALTAVFWGLKAAVLAIVLEALFKVAGRALRTTADGVTAGLSFLALFVFALPFPLVILVAALSGMLMAPVTGDAVRGITRPSRRATVRTILQWAAVWLIPLAVLHVMPGGEHILAKLGRMFSVLAVVTFGGAYAVLVSLGQTMVEQTGWLTAREMIDALALAETTPGPLILVGQFVAFLAAAKQEGSLWSGVAASLVFLWMTFTPCFLWIFAGAPWIDYLQSRPRLAAALARITAAVVGVILNLSLWFGLHVVFAGVKRLPGAVPVWWPDIQGFDPAALVLACAAALALLGAKLGIPKTLALSAVAGLLWQLVLN